MFSNIRFAYKKQFYKTFHLYRREHLSYNLKDFEMTCVHIDSQCLQKQIMFHYLNK